MNPLAWSGAPVLQPRGNALASIVMVRPVPPRKPEPTALELIKALKDAG